MSEPNELVPQSIGDVFPGVYLTPLKAGDEVETVFLLIKTRSPDGTTQWTWRSPGITNYEELLGASTLQVEFLKRSLDSLYEDWDS